MDKSTGLSSKRLAAAETIEAAEAVRDQLREALGAVGVVLPSLWIEAAAYGDENPRPLIQLGRCNMSTARKLIAVLGKARAS